MAARAIAQKGFEERSGGGDAGGRRAPLTSPDPPRRGIEVRRRVVDSARRFFRLPESIANYPPVRRLRDRVGNLSTGRWLLLVLGIGLLARLLLGPFSEQTDLETFSESSVTMAYGGSPYTYLVVYPPGWIYLLNLLGRLVELTVPASGILLVNPSLLRLFLYYGPIFPSALNVTAYSLAEKSLLWAFDGLISLLLYEIVLESTGSVRAARFSFALWFVNPLVITVSAVHGAYDVLPTFFAVAGMYLLVHQRFFAGGAALGAGILLKVFPIFLIPFTLALLLRQLNGSRISRVRSVASWSAGLGGILLVGFWPPGVFHDYVVGITTGPSIGEPYGGLWVYSLTGLPNLAGARSWMFHHPQIVGGISTVFAAVALLSVAIVYLWRSRAIPTMTANVAYGSFASLALGLTTLGVTQPQYLIWVLPWMILASGLDRRFLLAIAWITSLALAFYYVGLEGPDYLFLPLAEHHLLLDYGQVFASVAAWQTEISTVRTVVSISVFLILFYCLVRCLREIARRPGPMT